MFAGVEQVARGLPYDCCIESTHWVDRNVQKIRTLEQTHAQLAAIIPDTAWQARPCSMTYTLVTTPDPMSWRHHPHNLSRSCTCLWLRQAAAVGRHPQMPAQAPSPVQSPQAAAHMPASAHAQYPTLSSASHSLSPMRFGDVY